MGPCLSWNGAPPVQRLTDLPVANTQTGVLEAMANDYCPGWSVFYPALALISRNIYKRLEDKAWVCTPMWDLMARTYQGGGQGRGGWRGGGGRARQNTQLLPAEAPAAPHRVWSELFTKSPGVMSLPSCSKYDVNSLQAPKYAHNSSCIPYESLQVQVDSSILSVESTGMGLHTSTLEAPS